MAMRVQTEGTNHTKSRKENRDNRMTELLMNFCRCGIAGWCLEVMFTSVDSIMAGDWTLMGQTSLLMFPIYGMGALLFPISRFIDSWLTGLPGFEDRDGDRMSRIGRMIRHGLIYCGICGRNLAYKPWDLPVGLLGMAGQCGRRHPP